MKRALAVTVAALVSVPILAIAAPVDVDLTIAKTNRRIYAYGDVTPVREGRRVRVRFFHNGTLVATKRDAQDSAGGYEVSFARPTSGNCEVKVRYRTRSGTVSRAAHAFACAIPDFSTGRAVVAGTEGSQEFDIQIADEDVERGYGLMYRRWLGANRGMAFLFDSDTSGSFYMKNTLIPLTIAFFDATGQIVKIMDMEPCEADPCDLYDPETAYRGALEVNQGALEVDGSQGDTIQITRDP